MKKLALDTSVLAYLLPGARIDPIEKEQTKKQQALSLINPANQLRDDWTLCISAPAMAELQAGTPPEAREVVEQFLLGDLKMELLSLDLKAARKASEIGPRDLYKARTVHRQCFKTDGLIVACAIRWGCAGLCAFDGDHGKFVGRSGGGIQLGPPTLFVKGAQGSLFIK